MDFKEQLEFLLAGADVKRYHTLFTIQNETVGRHSHEVAMLCFLLAGRRASLELIVAALTHDLAEHQTGDLPSPSKRAYGIGEQVSALEEKLLSSVGFSTSLTPEEKRTLKIADILQGMIFCSREIQLGNSKMQLVLDRYKSYAAELILVGKEKDLYNAITDMSK